MAERKEYRLSKAELKAIREQQSIDNKPLKITAEQGAIIAAIEVPPGIDNAFSKGGSTIGGAHIGSLVATVALVKRRMERGGDDNIVLNGSQQAALLNGPEMLAAVLERIHSSEGVRITFDVGDAVGRDKVGGLRAELAELKGVDEPDDRQKERIVELKSSIAEEANKAGNLGRARNLKAQLGGSVEVLEEALRAQVENVEKAARMISDTRMEAGLPASVPSVLQHSR